MTDKFDYELKSRLLIPIRLRFPVHEMLEVVTFASKSWEFEENRRQLEKSISKIDRTQNEEQSRYHTYKVELRIKVSVCLKIIDIRR